MWIRLKLLLYSIGLLRIGSIDYESENTYIGRIQPLEAMHFKKGHNVLLTEGKGTIVSIDDHQTLPNVAEYVISIKNNVDGHKYLRKMETDLLQFMVFNGHKNRFIPLSFSDYDYIVENNQVILYRLTKRGFAKLIPDAERHYDWAKTVNTTKNGIQLYRELKRKGYELRRKDIS